MEYWRKNLSYKTKVFFLHIPPVAVGIATVRQCGRAVRCGRSAKSLMEGSLFICTPVYRVRKMVVFFFLFLLLCPRNTTLPVSFRIKYWATMQPCMHECDLPGCALDDH